MLPRKRLSKCNTPAIQTNAPAVVEAMLYLDRLQARGLRTTVRIIAGRHEASGESVLRAIEKLRNKVGE